MPLDFFFARVVFLGFTFAFSIFLLIAQASALNEARVMRAAPAAEVDAAAAETLPTVAVI